MITVYDANQAKLAEKSQCDLLLVGDSLGMVVQGHRDTLKVSMRDMLYHTECVRRGAPHSFIVTDLPFGSYQSNISDGIKNSVALIQAGANMVKLEGCAWTQLITKLVEAGIPVMGHLGLTPQSINEFGGFKVQGRGENEADKLIASAIALQTAGCSAVVLESIPADLAANMTQKLNIPTIGIGAGAFTDGQVLVWHDVLGLDLSFKPKFVKNYAELEKNIILALNNYCHEVQRQVFPGEEHIYL